MNYYNEIKNELINNEINRKVKNYSINKSDLNTYYNVGKMLSEAGKHYGEGIIKEDEVITLNIPAGVMEGMQLSMSGKGNAARHGGVPGDSGGSYLYGCPQG